MKTTRSSTPQRPDESTSFRHRLQHELARRCADNPQYSLRAFAADLDVDHSSLSQILRGKRRLTEPTLTRLAKRLRLAEDDVATYLRHLSLVETEGGDPAATVDHGLQRLARDAADAIAGWEHFALLELVHLPSFRADSRWIARVLGLEVDQVNLALQRLLHLGLLRMEERDRWVDCSGDLVVTHAEFSRAAIERMLAQTHELVRAARERADPSQYELSATTLALDSRRMPEVLARIAAFRRELGELAETSDRRDAVYRLEINVIPLSAAPDS